MQNKGIALVTALIVMVVVGILVTGALFNSLTSLQVSGNDRNATLAQYAAQAGATKMLTLTNQNSLWLKGHYEDYGLNYDDEVPVACADGNFSIAGVDKDRLRDGPALGNGKDARTFDIEPGDQEAFEIMLPDGSKGLYVITYGQKGIDASVNTLTIEGYSGAATATCSDVNGFRDCTVSNFSAKATNQLALTAKGGASYGDAILARDAGNLKIEGNVAAYGSVHSVDETGQGLLLQGGSGIYNTYAGKGNPAATDIRDEVYMLGGNPNEENLCAKVKLKSGNLRIQNNSARVGVSTDLDYNSENNEKAIAVYLAKNASVTNKNGNGGAPSGTVNLIETAPKVYSDYFDDYSNSLPELAANFPGEDINGDGAADATDSFTLNTTTISQSPDCAKFIYEVGQGRNKIKAFSIPPEASYINDELTCGNTTNYIKWTGTPKHLKVEGVVNITKGIIETNSSKSYALYFDDSGTGSPIYYNGKGTIRIGSSVNDEKAEIHIRNSLLPISTNSANAILPDPNASTHTGDCDNGDGFLPGNFVNDDFLGLVTSGNAVINKLSGKICVATVIFVKEELLFKSDINVLGSITATEISSQGNPNFNAAWHPSLNLDENIIAGIPIRPKPVDEGAFGALTPSVWEKR